MEEITIKIYLNSDGEYNYDIYDTNNVDDDTESIDGGTCTGDTIQEALSMATDHAKSLIENTGKWYCMNCKGISKDNVKCSHCKKEMGLKIN